LRESGIDTGLANHMAHLFIRDPLVLYKEKVFINCYLPSYPNLVNLFLIYIRNHFHFYSNQIIPFLF
jgi:hypothetical protein